MEKHHTLTNVQPVPKQISAAPGLLPPLYKLSMAFYDMECPFGQFGHLSWPVSLPAFSAAPH